MSARRPIQVMPVDLSRKIAAGEVIERPASAVKELIDNAIDGGATNIDIEVFEAGLKLIRIRDNGIGIPREELPIAFQSHATSKIVALEDLEHLQTLGFRGEALPSIAAVARVEVRTRPADADVGARYAIEFGRESELSPISAPAGLRISVSDLFSNVPARRKFVRSLRAESGQIQNVVMLYALAQPAIRFSLAMDGRLTFESPGTGMLRDAWAAVHGPATIDKMHPLEAQDSGIELHGLVSDPSLSKPNRSSIAVFINGRPVANRSLVFALEEAYTGQLMAGRHPVAAVHLVLDPGEIDANIHPSKAEVRLARNREVHAALHRAIAGTLLELRLRARSLSEGATPDGAAEEPEAMSQALPTQGTGEHAAPEPLVPQVPALRVFGQTNATFIIAEGPQGLYMIDQHAAHERILFDRLDGEIEQGAVASQPLLEAAVVELTPEQMAALEGNGELLTCAGFALEPFGTGACLVRAVPALSTRTPPSELVSEVLSELHDLPEPSSARERALAAMSCKAAVKAGQTLDLNEMRELVIQLERTARPSTCPHGRPTMIHLSHMQLEREFGRR